MSKHYGVVQDTSQPLRKIRLRNSSSTSTSTSISSTTTATTNTTTSSSSSSSSLVSSVLEIQRHANTRENWLKSLACLYLADDNEEPSGKRRRVTNGSIETGETELLRRRFLYPVEDEEDGRDYIAVSYTWQTSEDEGDIEEEAVGRYLVESRRAGEPALASEVRNTVWDRVLNYADHVDCENIWIDRECIDQEDEAEQEAAIQSMHLVYSLSRRPIALLTRPIETIEELDLLTDLMCGEVSPDKEAAVLNLLNGITSNLWWKRAWTFQEEYRASTRMTLLIPHHWSLEGRKQAARDYMDRPILGTIEGEICIKSVDFRRQATKFCLAYREKSEKKDICDKILKTAARYNVLLKEESYPLLSGTGGPSSVSRSMSPTILSDINKRGITLESDRLAIAANCSGYSTRLDTNSLNHDGSSLSLSILTLYLLNGEIIENDPKRSNHHRGGTLDDTIFDFLSKQSLRTFRPPLDEGGLTFIKNCRFIQPQLTPSGTLTRGFLWKLGKIIRHRPMKYDKYSTISPLSTFATNLSYGKYGGVSYKDLAVRILPYGPVKKYRARRWGLMGCMADEIENALLEGKPLRLASLVHPKYGAEGSPYRAVFVGGGDTEAEKDDNDWNEDVESYAFTAAHFGRSSLGDVTRHVSLEVRAEWPKCDTPATAASVAMAPRLYIKRWLNGLCFYDGVPARQVLFPWPAAMLEEREQEQEQEREQAREENEEGKGEEVKQVAT
ncbi:uncharacterized protein GGS25DRAFT_472680 [Hypoxylon fragiforme]|uniref:uncharacterized protein n=1 Tax=Hypoxylon fragiforme TaxID=63214 RepID=UPI0020C67343|nr:uncharacterized protein GGS25DRAFT_472680 [Hypoxylon fragiforme]KAI2614674.1 hypothetical protein GGS25DRAFT_472680 [Hypoxylon fragiforme]